MEYGLEVDHVIIQILYLCTYVALAASLSAKFGLMMICKLLVESRNCDDISKTIESMDFIGTDGHHSKLNH